MAPTPPPIAADTIVGGRFAVGESTYADAMGAVYAARDQKTAKPISLRILAGNYAVGESATRLRAECRKAARLAHDNIVATYGVGTHEESFFFIASEWVDGIHLSTLLEERSGRGEVMGLRDIYAIVAQVCNGLTAAHARTAHGALRPNTVWLTEGGQAKITEFGLAKAVIAVAGPAALGVKEQAWLAPEVKTGAEPTERSDIFGLGAVLYKLLTGKSPADGFSPPSQVHPEGTEAIDQVLLRCLAPDPATRFASPDDVRTALMPLMGKGASASLAPPGGALDIDIDLNSLRPPAMKAVVPPPATERGAGSGPQVGARVSIGEDFRASAQTPSPAARPSAAQLDLGASLEKITENDAPRWMVVKDGLDHGPFSGRELVDLLVKGDIRASDGLLNMDTGERCNIVGHHDFAAFAAEYDAKVKEEAHAAATDVAVKAETRSGLFKAMAALGIIALLLIIGAIFFFTREASRQEAIAEAEVADLYAVGEIQIEGSAGILPTPRRRHGRSGRGSGSDDTGGGTAGSYEEAMNRAVDLGDARGGGSERTLSPQQVVGVMNRHIGRVYQRCVPAEQRRGGNLSRVQLDIAIQSDGRVMGASARQGSSEFKTCIGRAMQGIRFPSFPALRMGARYTFAVD